MSATAATPWRYGNLVAAIATIASCDIALGFTFQLLPILMEMQHIPAWIIGLNTAMGPIGILLAGPILPRIISRVGAKRVAYFAVAFIMSALFLFKAVPSLYIWFPLRFALGIATGALFTISEAWILTFAGAGSRGRIMGIYTSVMAISFSLGPFMLPFTGTEGWLPWLIGISCLGLSILPLTLVNVSNDIFHDEKGGNFLRVIKRAPLLLFAVCTATLFDSVFISFFTIFGLRSGLTLQTASWVLGAGILGNLGFQYSDRNTFRQMVPRRRGCLVRRPHNCDMRRPDIRRPFLAHLANRYHHGNGGFRRLCRRTRHPGRYVQRGRSRCRLRRDFRHVGRGRPCGPSHCGRRD